MKGVSIETMVGRNILVALAGLAISGLATNAGAATVGFYQFQGTNGATVYTATDSGPSNQSGTLYSGNPEYSSNVPLGVVPQTGAADTSSLLVGSDDSLSFNYALPFESAGNATIQFWVDPTALNYDNVIIWGTEAPGDINRFQIGYSSGGALYMNYRDPSATLYTVAQSANNAVAVGQWTFVAITKTGNEYKMYANNVLVSDQVDSNPNASTDLPTPTVWTVNGREQAQSVSCCQFTGYLNDLELSNTALAPSQFLDSPSIPEPGTLALSIAGGFATLSSQRISIRRRLAR